MKMITKSDASHTATSSLWPRKDLGDYEWQSHMPSRWK